MAVKKARRPAKRSAKRGGTSIRIEFPGPPPTPEQRKQIEQLMGLVEVAFLALARGAGFTKMYLTKRR